MNFKDLAEVFKTTQDAIDQQAAQIADLTAQLATANAALATANQQDTTLATQLQTVQAEVPSLRDKIVKTAKDLMALQCKYEFGGQSGVNGIDCSRFVQIVFEQNGIRLPRVSNEQRKQGKTVTMDQIQPGDLIAFDRLNNDGIDDHIGISLGGHEMIHIAGNPEGINICDWTSRYAGVAYDIQDVIS